LVFDGPETGKGGKCTENFCAYLASVTSTTTSTRTFTTNTNALQTGCGCKRADGTIVADSGCNTPVVLGD
jgi:hypothetical protein